MRLSWTPTLAALALALPLAAAAQVKCVGPDGKVTYTDRCATDAKKSAVPGARPAVAEVQVKHYDVQGADKAALIAALRPRGGFHGAVEWKVSYSYVPNPDTKGICRSADARTRLEMTVNLPRWAPPRGADPDLVARWDRYVTALRTHQEKHLNIGREFERDLRLRLRNTSTRGCEKLDKLVRDTHAGMLERARRRERDLDNESGFGRLEGVELR